MQLSVIIPTYNRYKTLTKALRALFAQRGLERVAWEIIVVDDGSTDETGNLVAKLATQSPVPLIYRYQENNGPAAARNRGIRAATAPLVLLIGDDILARPDLLAHHLASHKRHHRLQEAILGPVDWAPTLTVTPFMRWWIENRFRFGALRAGKVKLDYWFFYTCNISLKRAFLLENGLFDEEFHAAAYEDTELAYRLSQSGLQIHFAPQAVAYHDHPTDFRSACRRMEEIGRWSLLFEAKTNSWSAPPTWIRLGWILRLFPRTMRRLSARVEQRQTKTIPASMYTTILMYHFWVGRRRALSGGYE